MDRNSKQPEPDVEGCEADELACQFADSFYSALNHHDVYHQGTQLYEHFWQDCKMQLLLNSEVGYIAEARTGALDVVQLICNTKIEHNIFFSPNVENKGVSGKIDKFGVFRVSAYGILHQQNKCFGEFEQWFQLIRDPSA
ncbi:uncharacterized protein C3orf38 homolog, partial [Cryptotermes secundus]